MESAVPLLSVENLVVEFATEGGVVRAVDGLSFEIHARDAIGIVGESGCGKSVTALAILGLIPSPPGRIASGSIKLNGKELVGLPEPELRRVRGNDVTMIFQEPMTALNPVFSIGNQMIEVLRRHKAISRREARSVAIDMLRAVGIPGAEKRIDDYPHELSGGMRQRVMIAMALSCNPKLLIADEPTTALDVTTQAQVLEEISRLQEEFQTAVMLITHDLGVVAETCRRILVMYCGQIIETADAEELFGRPHHPYTAGLLEAIPRIRDKKLERLPIIRGVVPDLLDLPPGCRFADRCPKVQPDCWEEIPALSPVGRGDACAACFYPN
jgi:peptide/nickel transport system ATP-binding protein